MRVKCKEILAWNGPAGVPKSRAVARRASPWALALAVPGARRPRLARTLGDEFPQLPRPSPAPASIISLFFPLSVFAPSPAPAEALPERNARHSVRIFIISTDFVCLSPVRIFVPHCDRSHANCRARPMVPPKSSGSRESARKHQSMPNAANSQQLGAPSAPLMAVSLDPNDYFYPPLPASAWRLKLEQQQMASIHGFRMSFLDDGTSWSGPREHIQSVFFPLAREGDN